jgi:hypothetical protein
MVLFVSQETDETTLYAKSFECIILFRIVEIDNHQRIQLAHIKSGETLKVKVAYDQIRPHVTSDLHKPVVPEVSINPDPSSCTDITDNDVPSNQSAVPCPINDMIFHSQQSVCCSLSDKEFRRQSHLCC